MTNTNNLKIGNKVYFVNTFHLGIERGTIVAFTDNDCVIVQFEGWFDYDGSLVLNTLYNDKRIVRKTDLLFSLEDAVALKESELEKIEKIKDGIKDIGQLFSFPFRNHVYKAETYRDKLVLKAYQEKLFEMTGIKIGIPEVSTFT